MTGNSIIDIFKREWPELGAQVEKWTPMGVGRIKVKLKNQSDLMFTYYDDDTWSMETLKYNKKRSK